MSDNQRPPREMPDPDSVSSDVALLSERPASVVQVFGVHPFQTEGELLALGFAPDDTLWSVEDPGILRRWDTANYRQAGLHSLDDVAALWVFSPRCRWLACGSEELSVYDLQTADLHASLPTPCWITAIAFSPDESLLATGHDDGSIRVWNVQSRQMLQEHCAHENAVSALAWSPDGKQLASAGEERLIHVWEIPGWNKKVSLVGHTDRIPALAWDPIRPHLISAGWDTTARIWNVATGEPVILLNFHATQVHALAVSPDGSLLATADSANAIHLWDLAGNRSVRVWTDQNAEVRALVFASDGRRIASGGADRLIQLKDVRETSTPTMSYDPMAVRPGVALSPDQTRLASLAVGTSLRVWDLASTRPVLHLEESDVLRAFAWQPRGQWIAASLARDAPPGTTGADTVTLYLWDSTTGQRRVALEGQAPPITVLAFSPDGQTLASAGYMSSDVWLWNIGERFYPKLLIPNALEGCSIEALAFHPDGKRLIIGGIDWMATGGSDGAVSIWDIEQKCELSLFGTGTIAMSLNPAGDRLVTASIKRTLLVWELASGNSLLEIKGHTEAVTAVAWSPDGRYLASASEDQTVRLWDESSGKALATVTLDTPPRALCYSGDGSFLFTCNGNATCYQLSVERMLADG